MTSFAERGRAFEISVKNILRREGVEVRRYEWVFHWVFVEFYVSEGTLPLGVNRRNWKRFVAAACESSQSGIQSWRTVYDLLWTFKSPLPKSFSVHARTVV